ncbi:S-adenosyl-l-methionine hydroxide adenosyltransferase family protein [Capnocytophaga sp.]|uniref:SAM hydrolase/SAM-dependent halogenase family protein n=1 Tax=Capnocytophaga sp. TaxID=44737 RepID=UPI0026DC0DFE|nr:SAM-dependent chlorinase/fluorinase [Capnocytophaga sp.]MDO5105733.1 SAM-dependent chlorinase/fluorinase [Capnocytophaga sp.]
MKIITLTTDFGERDYSVGAVKGAIYSNVPQANVVDISHLIAPFDIFQTAYVLKNAYCHFPKGSIHVIGVDAEATPEKRHLVMELDGHFFIGTDNGIFHLLCENKQDVSVYELKNEHTTLFPVLDFFPKIIAQICQGQPLEKIGQKTDTYLKTSYFQPKISEDKSFIYGEVIYIDHYGNVVSNIKRSLFEEVRQNRPFEVIFKMVSFRKIYDKYSDVINFSVSSEMRNPDGKRLILFNSLDFLQCSIYKSNLSTVGGASTLFGIEYLDRVTVRFENQ